MRFLRFITQVVGKNKLISKKEEEITQDENNSQFYNCSLFLCNSNKSWL